MRPVVLAIRGPEFQDGRVFDAKAVQGFRESLKSMASPWVAFGEAARKAGFEPFTSDQVRRRGLDPADMPLISYDLPPDSRWLLARGARPSILLSMEPPVIAWWLYFNLRRVSALFPHTFLFAGARSRAASNTRFHPLCFPVERREVPGPDVAWADRRLLVTVSSNKAIPRSLARWRDRPREVSLKREVAALLYQPIARDQYHERYRATVYFAGQPSFDLYGEGWEQRHAAIPDRVYRAALRSFRGKVGDKLALLGRYRFSLVFENSRFEGYLSEKLFDCFFGRCVPVYYGAPDVARYVPREAFVDGRRFRSYRELEGFLADVTEAEGRRYLEAGQAFLASAAFDRFTRERFAQEMVGALASMG